MVLQIEYVIVEITISSLIVEQQNHDCANHSLPCLKAHYSTIAGKNQRNKACRRNVIVEKKAVVIHIARDWHLDVWNKIIVGSN